MAQCSSARWVVALSCSMHDQGKPRSVALAQQHMLDGNPLGHFAVKKIAVGQSHSYLLTILREVRAFRCVLCQSLTSQRSGS